MSKKTKEDFIKEARLVHGDKYDYSKVEYVNNHQNVCIICPIHGEFQQTPKNHLHGSECYWCGKASMMQKKKKPLQEFLRVANEVHNGKYDYSLINECNYDGYYSELPIICPTHGLFYQKGYLHISGHGCGQCGRERVVSAHKGVAKWSTRTKVCDVGTNDYNGSTKGLVSYKLWGNMLIRCYDSKYQEKESTYKGCTVCDEWLYFSNFKKWFDDPANGYRDGYQLDKDILGNGAKVYSPETCCFVPQEINNMFTKYTNKDNLHQGLSINRIGRIYTRLGMDGKRKVLGTFDTSEEAFIVYKEAKESYIKKIAQQYYDEGKIVERTYNALMNYEVKF